MIVVGLFQLKSSILFFYITVLNETFFTEFSEWLPKVLLGCCWEVETMKEE